MEDNKENSSGKAPGALPTLLQSNELYEYILDSSVYPREPAPLKKLRDATATHPWGFMGTSPDVGQLMAMMMKMVNAKKTIEIGVFTGYSLLLTALNIPDDGKITAIDINREAYEIGLPMIKSAGVEHKIDFIQSQGLLVLDELLEDQNNEGSFDFAFVDADKENYSHYHKRLIKLVKVGGLIIYDNMLWGGTLVWPEESVPKPLLAVKKDIIEFGKTLAADPQIELSLAPLGDGIAICKRLS